VGGEGDDTGGKRNFISTCVHALPKAILHTHLEGSIPKSVLVELSRRNRIQLPFEPESARIPNVFTSGGWSAFASVIRAVFSCFRGAKDFADAVAAYGLSLSLQNVVYAEVHFSPWKHLKRGVHLDEIEQGLTEGIALSRRHHSVEIRIICDLTRDTDENAASLLDWISDLPRDDWPAIGISGGYRSLPLDEMDRICNVAHRRGLRVVVHAGELSGAESVRTAVNHLGADRVCHGVRVLVTCPRFLYQS
jgi:adenosine deaminase